MCGDKIEGPVLFLYACKTGRVPNQLFCTPKSYWYSGILQIVSLYDVYVNAEETFLLCNQTEIMYILCDRAHASLS